LKKSTQQYQGLRMKMLYLIFPIFLIIQNISKNPGRISKFWPCVFPAFPARSGGKAHNIDPGGVVHRFSIAFPQLMYNFIHKSLIYLKPPVDILDILSLHVPSLLIQVYPTDCFFHRAFTKDKFRPKFIG
jgi:hypothetical protein